MTRRTLLWAIGLVLLGVVVFALPLVATGVMLGVTMLLSPAVWIVGSSYAANGKQAFFRGGLIAGILPYMVASSVAVVLGMGGFFSPIYWVTPNVGVGRIPVASAAATAPGELAAPSYPATSTSDAPVSDSVLADPPAMPVPVPVATTVAAVEYRSPVSSALPQNYAETLPMRLTMAILWLAPGVFAFLGGTLGYVTWRLVTPKQESAPAALDYRVVSGRLTAMTNDQ
jgi:hypothetical protein